MFSVTEHDGNVVWNMTGLCLKFEGARLSGGASGGMLVYSSDSSEAMPATRPGDPEEGYDPRTGINTIKFAGRVVKLKRAGTLVELNGVEFVLQGKPKQTIVIPDKGKPSIRDYVAEDSIGVPLGELPVQDLKPL